MFRELAIDYFDRQGVKGVDIESLYNMMIGGCPGYLREITCIGCSNWVREAIETLVQQLSRLSIELNIESSKLVEKINELLGTRIDPLEDPQDYDLVLKLLDKNIVYIEKTIDRGNIRYIVYPQLPIYKHIIACIAMNRTLDPNSICNRVGFR